MKTRLVGDCVILPVLEQGTLFLGTIAAGFILAFIYDILRVFRKILPHPAFLIHIEDFLYWIFVIAIMYYFILYANNGEVRLFSILGAFIGMTLYFLTLSAVFLKFSMAIYDFIKKIVLFIVSILLAPFRLLAHILSYPLGIVKKYLLKGYSYEKRIYNGVKAKGRRTRKKLYSDIKIILKKI